MGSSELTPFKEDVGVAMRTLEEELGRRRLAPQDLDDARRGASVLDRSDAQLRSLNQKDLDRRLVALAGAAANEVRQATGGDDRDDTAHAMLAHARATGRTQVTRFNDSFLVVQPEDEGIGPAIARYQGLIRDRWGDLPAQASLTMLGWELRDRATHVEADLEIAQLARTPPRALEELLEAGAQRVRAGEYGAASIALFCELKHPAEIAAFVRHYVQDGFYNESLHAGQPRTRDEARAAALDNVRVGAARWATRGTEAAWRQAYEEVSRGS